ncbi:MAG: hypothetical protein SFV32_02840 [Opitutaceae bacterium]|nr:hypothetical protein [Opitutaceae bacterium]
MMKKNNESCPAISLSTVDFEALPLEAWPTDAELSDAAERALAEAVLAGREHGGKNKPVIRRYFIWDEAQPV